MHFRSVLLSPRPCGLVIKLAAWRAQPKIYLHLCGTCYFSLVSMAEYSPRVGLTLGERAHCDSLSELFSSYVLEADVI